MTTLDTRIEDLELPIRAVNMLLNARCVTVADICKLTKADLLSAPNCGRATYYAIIEELECAGLQLAEGGPSPYYRVKSKRLREPTEEEILTAEIVQPGSGPLEGASLSDYAAARRYHVWWLRQRGWAFTEMRERFGISNTRIGQLYHGQVRRMKHPRYDRRGDPA